MSERASEQACRPCQVQHTLRPGSNSEGPLTGNGDPPTAPSGLFPQCHMLMCRYLGQMELRTFPEQGVAFL